MVTVTRRGHHRAAERYRETMLAYMAEIARPMTYEEVCDMLQSAHDSRLPKMSRE